MFGHFMHLTECVCVYGIFIFAMGFSVVGVAQIVATLMIAFLLLYIFKHSFYKICFILLIIMLSGNFINTVVSFYC